MGEQWAFAAADLGASSGRVILGTLADGRFEMTEVHRFANGPTRQDDGLHWDADTLFSEVLAGLRGAYALDPRLAGIGIDTWGVDYGRVDAFGILLEQPFCYRDSRTDGVPDSFQATFGADRLYEIAGLQVQPFNTVFQLAAASGDPRWSQVERVLFTPDLFGWWLTGRAAAEVTMASTSGLLDVTGRAWSAVVLAELAARYGVPAERVLADLVEPGTVLGETIEGALERPVPVVAVGSHDTASAVVAVPAQRPDFAYISSGTWSLVGLELPGPVLTEESRAANFTNELGVDGTVRYLKNITGLWVLSECVRNWRQTGVELSWDALVDAASQAEPLACVIDIEDARLLPPGDMLGRLQTLAAETGQSLDSAPGAVARCVFDSLAVAYARAIADACRLADRDVSVVHIVGGGSRNALLCQLTAEATGLPVAAGPAEGTALGNLLVQARAVGALSGGLDALRRVAVASSEVTQYAPGALGIPPQRWSRAAARLRRDGS